MCSMVTRAYAQGLFERGLLEEEPVNLIGQGRKACQRLAKYHEGT